jgi:hypothetical protein
MKYMLMLKADPQNQETRVPTEEELNEMGRFNEEVIAAGAMLAGEGLHPVDTGSIVTYDGEERVVTDGPFAESKELIAGFWILQVASKEEALEWARRVPLTTGAIEVRRVFEVEDFPQDNEFVQKEIKWREEHEGAGRTA